MTPEEESRLLNGPFPWRLSGVIVTRTGALCSVEQDSERRPFDGREERRELSAKVQEEAERDVENLSRPELQATAQMTREELALKWDELKRAGKAVMERREHFKEWLGSRLQEAPSGEHDKFSWPFPYRVPTWAEPRYTNAWHYYVQAESHRGIFGTEKKPNFRQLQLHARRFNRLLYRYRTLRTRRRSVAYGSTERPKPDDYDPSPGAEKILSAVARLDQKHDGLDELDHKSEIWRPVHRMVGEGELNDKALNRLNQRLASDMEEKGLKDRFPETPEELVNLAREHAPAEPSQPFDNPVDSFEPDS
jgi:hypothetical protein